MQFVHGCTLQQKLDRAGPLPVPEILRLGIGIADGLAAAHRHGLVHRDVKPANILLENSVERVKITDFGLARAADDASLTQSGVIVGTPAYMSPEQANGERVDARSDLFSLGSVLYALCTGHPPFRADSAMAVLRRVCDDTPRPIREINPEIPEWLAAVVAKLQAKDPGQRFATAAEVAALLSRRLTQLQTGAEVSDSGSPAARPACPRPGPGKRLLTAGRLSAAVAVLGVVLVGWLTRDWWLPAPPPAADPAPGTAQPEPWKPRPPLSADELAKLPDPLDGWRRNRSTAGLLASLAGDAKDGVPELVGVLGVPFRLPRQEPTHWPTQTADGRLLALPCGKTVVLYDTATGAVVRILTGHTAQTHVGDFTADGKRFACGSMSGAIKVWDVATGKEELSFQDGANDVWGTLFSPDGKQLVTGTAQGPVKVWDAASGKAVKTLGQHEGGATFLAFNAAGTRLATAGVDGLVKVWDWPSGELLRTLEGHPDKIQDLAFSADGALLASGSQSRVVVWDVATLQPRHTLETAGGGLLGFTPDGRTLVAGPHNFPEGQKRAFTRWDVKTGTALPTWDVPGPRDVMVGRLSRDGRTVYLMSYLPPEARLGAYDAATGADRFPGRFPDQGHEGPVCAVAFSPDGHSLASGGRDGRVCLWDLATSPGGARAPLPWLTGHALQVFAVTFSPDGQLLASSSIDGTIRLSDAATGGVVQQLAIGPPPTPAPLAFSPDGETLAAGDASGRINLWVVKTGQPKEPLRGHVGFVHAVAFSPDGRWRASGGLDQSVQLIDRASGTRVHTFRGGAIVTCLAFSPDSQTLAAASGGPGPSVRLWDLATRAERGVTGDTGRVLGLAFHPEGNQVATGSLDGTARLWDSSAGGGRGRVFDFRHVGPAAAVAFSPSGRHLAVGLGNGFIAILRTPPAPAR
jgi:WD40 repeat protein